MKCQYVKVDSIRDTDRGNSTPKTPIYAVNIGKSKFSNFTHILRCL